MEEIGIKGFDNVRDIVNYWTRDNARTPMQWSDEGGAGFTEPGVEPWIKINPNHERINVKEAREDDNSILSYYRDLIELRKKNPVLVYGDYELLLDDHTDVYVYERSSEDDEDKESDRVLVTANFFDGEPRFSLPRSYDGELGEVMISNYEDRGETDTGDEFKLRPYEARVYRVM
jgi:glycosidase